MEVAGLALAIPPVLGAFLKIVKSIDDIRAKFKTIPSTMEAIAALCGTVHIDMAHLKSQQFREAILSVPEMTETTMENVEVILLGCKGVLCQIEAYTVQFALAAEQGPVGRKTGLDILQLTRLVWKEPEIKELLLQLRDYKDGIDTIRQICMRYVKKPTHHAICEVLTVCSRSLENIQTQLSQYTSALDILIERSRQSWNTIPSAILPSGHDSLRVSFISHISRFSTTALYINQPCDRQSTTAFDLDYEVANSKLYRRAMVDDARRASLATIRDSLIDSSQFPEERDKDSRERSRAKAIVPRPWDKDEARLRSSTPKWPLYDQQAGITRNFSRPAGSITPNPSDAGAAATSAAAPVGNFSQYSSSVDLGVDRTGPAASSPAHIGRSADSPSKPSSSPPETRLSQTLSPRALSPPRGYKITVLGGGGIDISALALQVSGAT
jgi:hypothetical protein